MEANSLLSQDNCLTGDVNKNQTHTEALAASLSKQQRRCYGTAVFCTCSGQNKANVSPEQEEEYSSYFFSDCFSAVWEAAGDASKRLSKKYNSNQVTST